MSSLVRVKTRTILFYCYHGATYQAIYQDFHLKTLCSLTVLSGLTQNKLTLAFPYRRYGSSKSAIFRLHAKFDKTRSVLDDPKHDRFGTVRKTLDVSYESVLRGGSGGIRIPHE